jgi:hypothetical protein
MEMYGEDNFNLIKDQTEKKIDSFKWDGNRYNAKQRQIIKKSIVQIYREIFPNSQISLNNISISDKDPRTDMEYMENIADKKNYYPPEKGSFIINKNNEKIFMISEISMKDNDVYKNYATIFGNILHRKFLHLRKRSMLKNSYNKEKLVKFLIDIFPFVVRGYSLEDIHEQTGYNTKEIEFWMKSIKNCNEIKKTLNFKTKKL